MDDFPLSGLDLGIIGAYFAVVLFIGFWVARRTKSGDDLFLAGRSLRWPAIGFSLFASNISSTTLIGLAGAAYTWGIAVSNYEWMAAVVLVIFVLYFVPFYIKSRISTVPEFLEKRFDRRSRVYFSALTLVANVIVDTAGALFAGAMVLKVFFPELDILAACVVLAVVAGLYTAAGGLAAVVYTDVIQAIILILGSCVLAYLTFAEVDFDWARVAAATPPNSLSVILPIDDPHLPWLGTLIGVPILGFYFWCTNQFIVQRVLGARDTNHARRGCLLAGLLKLPVLFIMVLPGTIAVLVVPDLPRGDMVFPALVTELLPVGAMGLVMAGLVAAIMSSIDSTLNSASALVTLDFIKPRFPDMTPKQTALVGRVAIGVFMILAAVFAPVIGQFEGLFDYLQTALAYLVPPVVVLFVLGLFWKRGNGTGALATLIGGHSVSVVLFVLNLVLGDAFPLHYTIVAGLLFALCSGIFVVTSLMSAPPSAEAVRQMTYSRDMVRADQPQAWYADYRVHAAVILVLTAALVITFW